MPRQSPRKTPLSLAFVGEAFGEKEEQLGVPFVGPAGRMLDQLCEVAGFRRTDCYVTNVFWFRPPGNKISALCARRLEVTKTYKPLEPSWPNHYSWPPIGLKEGSLKPEFLPELFALKAELEALRPNLVVALGNVPCWALLGTAGIKAIRGTVTESTLVPGLKVLPTYHPASLFRDYTTYPVVVMDLMKALRECKFPEIRRPNRHILVSPTLEELQQFKFPQTVACDIETYQGQISCIGFATCQDFAIVIPFIDLTKPGHSYWPDSASETAAWELVRRVLEDPGITKIFQNGLYDMQYLWKVMGIRVLGTYHDTMMMHHSVSPESPKSLGFLGSLYTDEAAWKLSRRRDKEEGEKRDE